MNPFEKHGIKHLSPSSLNLWQAEPALWMLRYLHQFKDAVGPAAHRGSAVEGGLEHWLQHRDLAAAGLVAHELYASLTDGLAEPEHEAERALITPMLQQATVAMEQAPPLTGKQLAVETYLPGIEVPVIGYLDFMFEGSGIVDLKTTKALPSQPRLDHVRQVAIYVQAHEGSTGSLLYVTPKKYGRYDIPRDDLDAAIADMTRVARSLKSTLTAATDKDQALNFAAPNFDSFYWSNAAKAKALEVWNA